MNMIPKLLTIQLKWNTRIIDHRSWYTDGSKTEAGMQCAQDKDHGDLDNRKSYAIGQTGIFPEVI